MPGRTFPLLIALLLASLPLDASRLSREKSPYLRDHADNLVSWNVWGEPAFEKARSEGKPIFLSIGYAACHWCHVMERESFMNPEVAALINEKYVAVLVDREEHPDVDATYLAFLEATQGSAGWPANLILAPDLKPLAGTTYVKPEPLSRFLRSVADRWSTNRAALLASRDQLLMMAAELNARPSLPGSLSEQTAKRQLEILKEAYDSQNGGFGTAPKFPQALAIDFLLRYSVQQKDKDALGMALRTLRAITASGIHDRIGGGFHRYATDRQWRAPHFEKMLYDQALLAIALTEAWQLTEERQFLDSTRLTLDFVLRELSDPAGGFHAALDADSAPRAGREPVDGAFYTWSAAELRAVAGNEAGEQLVRGGNAAGEPAGRIVLTTAALDAELRKKLFAARASRPRPATDDKIITGWNGLMISALARAGAALEEPRYIEAAVKAARFAESRLWDAKGRRLHRHYANGASEIPGVAQDYALLTGGLIDLFEASFDVHWLDLALTLQRRQDALFWDEAGRQYRRGGTLSKELSSMAVENDFALPSANSASAMNLIRLGEISDNESWRKRAELILGTFAARLTTASDLPQMGSALLLALGTPKQIVIAGERHAADTKRLISLVNRRFLPSRVLLLVDDASRTRLSVYLPLLRTMKPIRKRATAYVCEHYICKLPTSDPVRLKQLLE